MSVTASASGFVVFLLSVSVVQGQNGWGVTYSSTEVCGIKGSTVELRCSYTHPSRIEGRDTTVQKTFWFNKPSVRSEPVDLTTDPEYTGRVHHHCDKNNCVLTIRNLRQSDSAEYKFRFITKPDGRYHGSPGVTLSVTDLQVQVSGSYQSNQKTLTCHSSCRLPDGSSYVWYKNGQKLPTETSSSITVNPYRADSYSCAVRGHEDFPSASVCVDGSACNTVTYTVRTICAFRGSSVDISCTYNSYGSVTSKFWFSPEHSRRWQSPSQPEDLSGDSQYAGRVQVLETETGRSTLRISDLRESNSAQYRFTFKTPNFELGNSLPGTTLTVTALQVQITRVTGDTYPTCVELKCHSSCRPARPFSYVWFRNGQKISTEPTSTYTVCDDTGDNFSCAVTGQEEHRAPVVYPPKPPSVSVSPSAEVEEGSSVTLTCSSDANPAANYTWYKKNGNSSVHLLSEEPQLVFSSIQSSDSGQYYCTAENTLGRRRSESIPIDVKYPPKTTSLSVSPSAEVEEGSSVTLTCSSDANPAANYTWYKGNQTVSPGPQDTYHFPSIKSEDSGVYYCMSENKFGQINSTSVHLDVQYPPKSPSVSVSPSAEVEEGSSVTLTCSSDANPAATYTWYKENEESPKASGQNFTITDFRPEHSGNYYCEVQNRRGRHSSTVHLTVAGVTASWKPAVIGTISAAVLAVVVLSVVLVISRKKRASNRSPEPGQRPDNGQQVSSLPTECSQEEQDELHYASVQFSRGQAGYSNIRAAQPQRHMEEDEPTEYAAVRLNSAGPRATGQSEQDAAALYSTINKTH